MKRFFSGGFGRLLIIAACCVAVWGIIALLISTNSEVVALFLVLVLAYFGWISLNRIQPAMFLWMPLGHWLWYFFIKFILSVMIGWVVAPFIIGIKIGGYIHDQIR